MIQYGLSTSWYSRRHSDGQELLNALLATEMPAFELDYRISSAMVEPLIRGLKGERRSILSLHHPFPHPDFLPVNDHSGDALNLSAIDNDLRRLAVKYAIRTIQQADNLEVQAVVLHLGYVEMPREQEAWFALNDDNAIDSPAGKAFVERKLDERLKVCTPYVDAMLKSVDEINEEAVRREIYVGIENRYFPTEIPNYEELGRIFKEFTGGNLRYWHDCGHAQTCESIAGQSHLALLEAYGEQLLGIHLHDAIGYRDHLPPGQGVIDFLYVRQFLKPDTIRILEIHESTIKELHEAVKLMQAWGILE